MSQDYPYQFQQLTVMSYLQGQNMLLQAPCGAGKTRASIEPGLIGLTENLEKYPARYPQKIIVCAPMRTLVSAFYETHIRKLQPEPLENETESDAIQRVNSWEKEWYPTIQTGIDPQDPCFEGRLVFCTVDQMLASFLNLPYGLGKRFGNMNMGAFIGSYIIFDEFHLYPRDEMLLTVLAMLKILQEFGAVRFCLMSATMTQVLLHGIKEIFDIDIISQNQHPNLFADCANIQSQTRTWHRHEGQLTAERIAQLMGERTLVVCNTVDQATSLYEDFLEKYASDDINARLLHSRFYPEDRQKHENWAIDEFSKKDNDTRVILFATQVIEVGLDISATTLITESAPANSLVQRAGRCARREDEHGKVHVFQPYRLDHETPNLVVNYVPYVDDGFQDVCEKTWEVLAEYDSKNPKQMDYTAELALVEAGHAEHDQAFIEALAERIQMRQNEILEFIRQPDPTKLPTLIRQNQQVQLWIHPTPNKDDKFCERLYEHQSFGVSRGQISRMFTELNELDIEAPFLFKFADEAKDPDPEDPDSKPRYKWEKMKQANDSYQKHRFVAHPEAVTYTSEKGLQWKHNHQADSTQSPHKPKTGFRNYTSPADTYTEHIHGLYLAYTQPVNQSDRQYSPLRDEYSYVLRCLFGDNLEPVHEMIRLVIALHDVGKLQDSWQNWAQAYQTHLEEWGAENGYEPSISPNKETFFAHTDRMFNNAGDKKAFRESWKQPKRGNHAVEGAVASFEILKDRLDEDLLWVAMAAIMRHHTPTAKDSASYQLKLGWQIPLQETLAVCGIQNNDLANLLAPSTQIPDKKVNGRLRRVVKNLDITVADSNNRRRYLQYAVIVRILRLADQRSFSTISKVRN